MYSRGKIISKLVFGLDQLSCQQKVGDILVTAAHVDAYDGVNFPRKLRHFYKDVLRKLFTKGVSVVTRSDGNRLHVHIAAEMPSLCTSFDWISFEQAERYYELFKKTKTREDLKFYQYYLKKFRRSLPIDWQLINRKLMAEGKKYGLGRVFLTPVRKNLKALKWYLVSNVPYKRDPRDKGVHFFLAWGIKRANGFQIVNKYTRAYRAKLKKFAQGLQLNDQNYNITLRSVLGSNWYFKVSELVKYIDSLTEEQQLRYENLQRTVRTHLLRSS